MKRSEAYPSPFLKSEDLLKAAGNGYDRLVVTIAGIHTSEPFDDGKTQRVLKFKELPKELGLNVTNWENIAEFTGVDDDEGWIGEQIELYVDPRVRMGNRVVPAIRVCAPGRGGRSPAVAASMPQRQDTGMKTAIVPTTPKRELWIEISGWTGIGLVNPAELGQAGKLVQKHLGIPDDGSATLADINKALKYVRKMRDAQVIYPEWAANPSQVDIALAGPRLDASTAQHDVVIDPEDIPF